MPEMKMYAHYPSRKALNHLFLGGLPHGGNEELGGESGTTPIFHVHW
jgi:hypothetical protein